MRFAANLSILWPDLPLLERPAAAAAAGFRAAELWWPFAGPVPAGSEADDLVAALRDAGVQLVLLNLWLGDREAGQHGLLSVTEARADFLANVDAVADIVGRLGGSIVNSHFGNLAEGADRDVAADAAVASLALAGPRIAEAGATLVVEALNPFDFPRYGLHHVTDAAALVCRAREAAGADVRVLFDAYHVQRTEGDVLRPLRACAAEIGHVQIADVPGRGRPGSGTLDWDAFFGTLEGVWLRGLGGPGVRALGRPL